MFSRKRIAVAVGLLFLLLILAASVVLRPVFGNPWPIDYARWLVWSRSYKAEVLAQPDSANKELKHIEWDGWDGRGWTRSSPAQLKTTEPEADLLQVPQVLREAHAGGQCKRMLGQLRTRL